MEIWELIKPEVAEIIIGAATIAAIIVKGTKTSKLDKLKLKQIKAHSKSIKKEKQLHKAYQKEANIDKEVENYASGRNEA